MSQVSMNPQADGAYTLRQFQDLASRSRDDQELRIRQSNQELSNTPLGMISRHGVTHASSNAQANMAFLHAISTDKRYQCIAQQLLNALSTTQMLTDGLTAGKVKSAVATADSLLKTYQEGSRLAQNMADQGLLPTRMMAEFASFYVTYCTNHPERKPDLRDFGDASQLPQEQQGLDAFQKKDALQEADHERLEVLESMFKKFFSRGDRLQRSGLYRFQPADCGNDAQKAQKMQELFAKTSKDCGPLSIKENRKAALDNMFKPPHVSYIPDSGSILSKWKDEIHKTFLQKNSDAWTTCRGNRLDRCSSDDLDYLIRQAPVNATAGEKQEWLHGIETGLDTFLNAHPQCTAQDISRLLRHLCAAAQQSGVRERWGYHAAAEFSMLRQVEAGACDALLRENGLDSPLGRAALRGADFREAALKAFLELDINRREADIRRAVQAEAEKFLAAHGEILRTLAPAAQNLSGHQLDMLVHVAVPFTELSQTLADAGSSDVALLRQANMAADKFFCPGMTAGDRSVVVKTMASALFGSRDGAEMATVCGNAKPRLEGLLGQMASLLQQPGITPGMRECCDKTATLLNVLYTNMLERVPEDQQQALLLQPPQPPAVDPHMAMQMEPPLPGSGAQPLRPVPRQATSAEIFAAAQKLEAQDQKGLAAYLLPIMEKTRCADTALLNMLSGYDTNRLSTAFTSLHTKGDYATDLKHFYEDLMSFGDDIRKAARRFPQYTSGELAALTVDMFIASHTDEQLAKTLDALQSPEAQLPLSVLYNHAVKESEALKSLPAAQSDVAGRSKEKLNNVFTTLASLNPLMKGIAARLGRPEPAPISFLPGKTMRDLPQHDQLSTVLPEIFRAHLNHMDSSMFPIKARLTDAQYDLVKNFFAGLKMPDGSRGGRSMEVADRYYDLENPNMDEDDPDQWRRETLAMLISFHAGTLSKLLEQTNGNPPVAQLWGVLHGGPPPEGLTMDNFSAKLMQRFCDEMTAFQAMTGSKPVGTHDFMVSTHFAYGIPPFILMDKFSNVQHEDVTITMQDQKLFQGLFTLTAGTQFKDGSHAYGFGADFIRAGMPPGAEGNDGCKITIVRDGKEQVFTQKEYNDFNVREEAQGRTHPRGELGHPYLKGIVDAARPLCQTDAQLATVGLCTTQAVQMSLRYAGQIYKDVTGGVLEHTALDHRIEKQEDGSVKVTITEKPGSLFKFDMEISVDAQGNPTMTRGEITFPSLAKWNAFKQEHPEYRLR